MKRVLIMSALSVLMFPAAAFCEFPYELGFIAGEPNGISGKLLLKDESYVDGAMSWSFSGDRHLTLHADHLWFVSEPKPKKKSGYPRYRGLSAGERRPFYYGIGARIKLQSSSRLGARFPFGLQANIDKTHLTFFLEAAPIVDLMPATGIIVTAAAGLRYRFGEI